MIESGSQIQYSDLIWFALGIISSKCINVNKTDQDAYILQEGNIINRDDGYIYKYQAHVKYDCSEYCKLITLDDIKK